MYSGPHIKRDGLVFGYDTGYPLVSGNSDTYKFNRGEPTENLIANTNLINVVDGTFTTNTTVDGVRILENNQVNNSHVMWNSATGFIITCSAGAYITVSAEYKTDCTIRMRFRDNPYDTQFDIDGGNINTISETSVDINTIGEWKRHSLTAQTSTANPDLWWYLADYRPNNEFGRVEVRNWQIEVKPHATPFTTGTRSVSGSLIDLTRTTDIDLSNVSFDSNAQMTFDGTDDSIVLADPGVSSSTGFSIELVIKPGNASSSPMVIVPLSGGIDHYIRFNGNGTLYLRMIPAADSSAQDFVTSSTLSSSNYHHVIFTFKQSEGGKAFYNGSLENSASANFTALDWTSTWRVGQRGNNTFFYQGELPILKIYNRALSAQEVQQNFRAYKNRFDI